jgi:hypothetical protein
MVNGNLRGLREQRNEAATTLTDEGLDLERIDEQLEGLREFVEIESVSLGTDGLSKSREVGSLDATRRKQGKALKSSALRFLLEGWEDEVADPR